MGHASRDRSCRRTRGGGPRAGLHDRYPQRDSSRSAVRPAGEEAQPLGDAQPRRAPARRAAHDRRGLVGRAATVGRAGDRRGDAGRPAARARPAVPRRGSSATRSTRDSSCCATGRADEWQPLAASAGRMKHRRVPGRRRGALGDARGGYVPLAEGSLRPRPLRPPVGTGERLDLVVAGAALGKRRLEPVSRRSRSGREHVAAGERGTTDLLLAAVQDPARSRSRCTAACRRDEGRATGRAPLQAVVRSRATRLELALDIRGRLPA